MSGSSRSSLKKRIAEVSVQERIRKEQIDALGTPNPAGARGDHAAFHIPRTSSSHEEQSSFSTLFRDIEDWALEDDHEPQSFPEFKVMERWKLTKTRRTIFILPISEGVPGNNGACVTPNHHPPTMESLAEFTSCYFSLPVTILPPATVTIKKRGRGWHNSIVFLHDSNKSYPIKSTRNEFGQPRLHVGSILDAMMEHIPKAAYCVLAVTLHDIYEDGGTENVIMGRGSGDRVGILSLYRFNPNLDPSPPEALNLIPAVEKWLLDSCKTLAHETMHMFGLDHCTYFICVMNANVSPDDTQAAQQDPLYLCPICLKKLHHTVRFDVGARYRSLLAFCEKYGWGNEGEWFRLRMEALGIPAALI